MKKEIIINSTNEDTRIALVENGKLVEIFVERPDNERMVGDIYKGRIRRVVKGMQAAFINIGFEQDAFLHFSDMGDEVNQLFADIDVEMIESKQKQSDIDPPDLLRNGQEINVQIIKEPIITKGPRVTTELTLPGRFMVLAPNQNRVGVSRKISSIQERKRLRTLARKIRPKNFGIIVRTVAEHKDEATLKTDLQKLMKTWRKVQTEMKKSQPPKLIFKDLGMASSVIRDLFTDSDIISLHVPLTDETKGIINKETISTMKDGVIIINTARGKLINEGDLADALKSGKVSYAGLDVFESEPPKDSPLLECDNVLFTPHLGAQTYENMDRITEIVIEIISEFAKKHG